ncbi:MAG: helix-turn-helix transcriptional regulator [Bdellovibrionaceae bacterium]|nr:helix-turn-helix transcriptional regulator [Pseudobdellovibrionaceae bacterium]
MYSKAENSVVTYIMNGLPNKEIADLLCVSEKTIKFHITNIYKKAGVRSRAEFISESHGNRITIDQTDNFKKIITKQSEVSMNDMPQGSRPVNPSGLQQGARQVQVIGKSQEDKITFIDEKFRVGDTITTLHNMMKEVTKDEITPNTVNAACNCVARLNETINTAIQAAKFLNER